MIPGAVAAALGAWLVAATVYQAAAQVALWRLLARRPPKAAGPLPSATILRPLAADAPRLEENLATLCALGAPVVVGVESDRSEAAAAARRVLERAGSRGLTLVSGRGPEGSNRKIATLIRMLPESRGEIIVLTDGDVAVPPGYLEAVLAPFADPGVGVVTCPYRSVGGDSLASRIDVILTNTIFLPSVALAARLEGARFALGATIAVRRTVLDAIGGLDPLLDVLADDWAIADGALRGGHGIVLAPLLLDHHVDSAGWRATWLRHLRWARSTRAVRPAGYAGTIVTLGWAPALGLALAGGGAISGAALGAYALARIGSAALNARRMGLRPRDLLLLPVADAVSMALYAGGLLARTVQWGGVCLSVGNDGSIRAVGPKPAAPDGRTTSAAPITAAPGTARRDSRSGEGRPDKLGSLGG